MNDILTVLCWKWQGWRANTYDARHVNALQEMVLQNLRVPHRFICVTDNPYGLRCENYPLWPNPPIEVSPGRPNCYRRLKVFSPWAKNMFGNRLLSLDLDCVILKDISDMITDDDFKIVKGKAAPYNGSMFLVRPGTRPDVWDDLNKHSADVVRRHAMITKQQIYGSDQGWLSYKYKKAPVWGQADGVYHYTLLNNTLPDDARIVFFAGSNKPWSERVRLTIPALYDMYQQYNEDAEHGRYRAAGTR